MTKPKLLGTHHPTCDTVLGPDFDVADGVVTMTIFACFGECWHDTSDDE